MKKILLLASLILLTAGFADAKVKRFGHANFEIFYSSLSPYGEWIEVDFGYVWRPLNVRYGWRPYMYGRWVWSRHGWYWVSNEPFGWATFHYGRWSYDDYYGWIWIPDDTWGPAWVEWRYDDDYIGWAPLPPHAHFSIHVGISFGRHWVSPWHHWNFVTCRNFTRSHVVDYVQPSERSRRIFGRTRTTGEIRMEGDRIVNRGIDRDFVERRGRTRIDETDIVTHERERSERIIRDGDRSRVETYAPRMDRRGEKTDARPERVRKAERSIRIEGMEQNQGERVRRESDDLRKESEERRTRETARERVPGRSPGREYTPRGNRENAAPPAENRDMRRERSYDRPGSDRREENTPSPAQRQYTPRSNTSPDRQGIAREPRKSPGVDRPSSSPPPRSIERPSRPERQSSPSRDSGKPENRTRGSERKGRP